MTKADYAARIPPCCSYRTLEDHINGLGLCWSLVSATEQNAPMDCSLCDLVIPGVRTLNWSAHTAFKTPTESNPIKDR